MAWPTAQEILNHGGCLTYDGDEPDIFYHCTPTENLDSIMQQGLTGGHGKTFGTEKWAKGRIFLSLGYEEAVQWQGMVASHTAKDVAILQIKLTKKEINNLQMDREAYGDGFVCSFYTTDRIPASRISVADTGEGTGERERQRRKNLGMEESLLRDYIKNIITEELNSN